MNYALQAPNRVLRSLHNCDRPWSDFTYQPPPPKISVSDRLLYKKRCCNVWQGEISESVYNSMILCGDFILLFY